MLFFLLFGPGRAQQLANTICAWQLVTVGVWARLSIGSQTPARLGRAESVQVRKQAALQQLGQTCPGLVRLGWLGHAGPGAQTRPIRRPTTFNTSSKLNQNRSTTNLGPELNSFHHARHRKYETELALAFSMPQKEDAVAIPHRTTTILNTSHKKGGLDCFDWRFTPYRNLTPPQSWGSKAEQTKRRGAQETRRGILS